MTGTLANLTEKVNQMAEQETRKIETISTREFENLRENLNIVMQSELRIMEKDISGVILEMRKRLTSQIKILNISFAQRWLVSFTLSFSIVLGAAAGSMLITKAFMSKISNLRNTVAILENEQQLTETTIQRMQTQTWGILLTEHEGVRYVVLPPNTPLQLGGKVDDRPAIKLE